MPGPRSSYDRGPARAVVGRTPVLAVDHVRLQLAETEAGALRECLQGCLAYAGCVEICTVHVHIVHRTTVEVLSAVGRVLHPTRGCLCLDRAQPLRSRCTRFCLVSARFVSQGLYLERVRVSRFTRFTPKQHAWIPAIIMKSGAIKAFLMSNAAT